MLDTSCIYRLVAYFAFAICSRFLIATPSHALSTPNSFHPRAFIMFSVVCSRLLCPIVVSAIVGLVSWSSLFFLPRHCRAELLPQQPHSTHRMSSWSTTPPRPDATVLLFPFSSLFLFVVSSFAIVSLSQSSKTDARIHACVVFEESHMCSSISAFIVMELPFFFRRHSSVLRPFRPTVQSMAVSTHVAIPVSTYFVDCRETQ